MISEQSVESILMKVTFVNVDLHLFCQAMQDLQTQLFEMCHYVLLSRARKKQTLCLMLSAIRQLMHTVVGPVTRRKGTATLTIGL